jgi:hypothetical protein
LLSGENVIGPDLAHDPGTSGPSAALHPVSWIQGLTVLGPERGDAMADRVLRGSRLGTVSYETDRDHDLAPRRQVVYACPKGHEFTVSFADDVEPPITWECRLHGNESRLFDGDEPQPTKKIKPPRTHWDMLLERRSIPELEELLDERLTELRGRRSRSA